jgi:hypothetical protein
MAGLGYFRIAEDSTRTSSSVSTSFDISLSDDFRIGDHPKRNANSMVHDAVLLRHARIAVVGVVTVKRLIREKSAEKTFARDAELA